MIGIPVELENRAVTGVEGRVMCGALVKAAAPGAGVNVPVSMEPFACAGRKPGWSPKMASNCFSRSSAKATIFSSEGSGMMTSCDTVAEVSRRRSSGVAGVQELLKKELQEFRSYRMVLSRGVVLPLLVTEGKGRHSALIRG
jgi:hypothetical protein